MTATPSRTKSHQIVFTVDDLLTRLDAVAQITMTKLVVVHVSWHGCSGCLGPLEAALLDLEKTHNVELLEVPWRTEKKNFAYDYRYRITAVYRVWEQLVLGKLQRLGGFQETETYPVPPWDRPHFPQVFLLDNRALDSNAIRKLQMIHTAGDLINNGNEVMEVEKESHDDPQDFTVRDLLRNVVSSHGVLLQMLNEHLFQRNDDELQKNALISTVECAQNYQNGKDTFGICTKYLGRYVAKRIWRG